MARVYTGKGDDGTTGLLYGGRVPKDDPRPEAVGAVDEAQAAIGLARAVVGEIADAAELNDLLLTVERDLYVLMAEVATDDDNRAKLDPGTTMVTEAHVEALSAATDDLADRFAFPTEFVLPGQTELAARLDVARTVARRAERRSIALFRDNPAAADSQVVPYLNRLSSLLWTAARWVEAGHTLPSKSVDPAPHDNPQGDA